MCWPNLTKFQVPKNFQSKFPSFQLIEVSLNFNSIFITNLEKFLWRKLFILSKSSRQYFISKFPSSEMSFLEQSKFERI
jgi:hypothetical protein